jgi:hypothetical protein
VLVAQSIVDCLRDAGAQVLIANKASDALWLIERAGFAAAVLDVALGMERVGTVADSLVADRRGASLVPSTLPSVARATKRRGGSRTGKKSSDPHLITLSARILRTRRLSLRQLKNK